MTRFEQPGHFEFKNTSGPFALDRAYAFTPTAAGTRVTFRFEMAPKAMPFHAALPAPDARHPAAGQVQHQPTRGAPVDLTKAAPLDQPCGTMGREKEADMGALRWSRAALLAAVAVVTGVFAHGGAGGRLPGALALFSLFVLLTLGCAMLLVARASAVRVVALVVAGQTFIHLALTVLAGHGGKPAHAEHLHAAAHAKVLEEATELTGAGALMALAHLGAAVLIGLWLAYGEAALFALLALLLARIQLLLVVRVQVLVAPPRDVSSQVVPARLYARLGGRVLCRRGPPAGLLVTV